MSYLSLIIIFLCKINIRFNFVNKALWKNGLDMLCIFQCPHFHGNRVYLDRHRDLIICCVREFYVLAEPVDNIGHDIPFRDEFHSYAFGLVEQYTYTRQIMGITLAYIYALQRITSCKDIMSNVYYTVWYCYVFQGCASRKNLIPNAYHTVRNCYALQ